MNKTLLSLSVVSLVLSFSALSFASEPAATATTVATGPNSAPSAPNAEETRWYGYQPLITDSVAVTLTTAGVLKALTEIGPIDLCGDFDSRTPCHSAPPPDHTVSTTLLVSGVVTYAFASPTIHAIHGHWDKAGLSLGLRAAPIALAAPLLASGSDGTQRVGGGVLVAAMVVDDILIAREPTKETAAAFTLAPTFDAKNGSAGLAAAGTF